MIIEKILKQLTPERVKKEIDEIQKVKLPPELQKWIKEYERIGKRNRFFWQWLYRANQLIIFPGIAKKYQISLRSTKTLFNMFLSLLDDIADRTRNKKLLNELLRIPFESDYVKTSNLNSKEKRYLKFAKKLWKHIKKKIRTYPRYKELKEVFKYDVTQMLNGMKYANLINKNPYLINVTEYWLYLSHNMQAVINLTLDLLCFPKFDLKKLGTFREIAGESQKMARVGNWVSTWEREIEEKDFTGWIFAYAIQRRAITHEVLRQHKNEKVFLMIKHLKPDADKILFRQWEKSYKKIGDLGKSSNLNNIEVFQQGLERLLFMHLSSQGYK